MGAIGQINDGTAVRRPNPASESTYHSFPTAADKRAFLATGRRFLLKRWWGQSAAKPR